MDLRELETFLVLAEELHFARTAQRLYLTPGRVSQIVQALEREVGAPLVERSSRRVALTPLGERFRDATAVWPVRFVLAVASGVLFARARPAAVDRAPALEGVA